MDQRREAQMPAMGTDCIHCMPQMDGRGISSGQAMLAGDPLYVQSICMPFHLPAGGAYADAARHGHHSVPPSGLTLEQPAGRPVADRRWSEHSSCRPAMHYYALFLTRQRARGSGSIYTKVLIGDGRPPVGLLPVYARGLGAPARPAGSTYYG